MNKLALITGTGSGIGKSLAKLLLKEGYKVVGYSRTNNINHPNFQFIQIDLSIIDNVRNICLPDTENGNVVLINNAATIGEILPFNKKKEENIISEYNLNIITPSILSNKLINTYHQKKLILNIGSGAAKKSIPSWSTYCSTKAAIDRLSDTIAEENILNLKVFSIHPGIVDTNMQSKIRNTKEVNFALKNQFVEYYETDQLECSSIVARKIHIIIQNPEKFNENILSIRNIELS